MNYYKDDNIEMIQKTFMFNMDSTEDETFLRMYGKNNWR